MSDDIEENEINIDEIEFREISAAEYIAQLDDKMQMAVKSQVGPMSFAMKGAKKLSPAKLLRLPWGKFSKLLQQFNKSQGIDSDFLEKR